MKGAVVSRVVSAILLVVGLAMMSSVAVAWAMGDSPAVIRGLLLSALITMAVGGLGVALIRARAESIGFRDGFGIVTFSWLAAAVFGAIPYILVGDLSVSDAFFETMSGFTTTGASILTETRADGTWAIPNGLLFWRALTQWLGGMGIVVLSLAILPILGIGGMQLYRAETPGPTSDQLAPRIASAAKLLWGVYILLTVTETVLLMLGGMSLFDAFCHTCTTVATAGFSNYADSIMTFKSVYIEIVIIGFMILGGCNFALHLRAMRGEPLCHFRDEEFRFYALLLVIATATIAVMLVMHGQTPRSPGEALRHAAFTSVSMMTATGFSAVDYDLWPAHARLILLSLMIIGGCAGSTSSALKVSRLLLLLKNAMVQIRRSFYPHSIINVRLNDRRVNDNVMSRILIFFFIYIGLIAVFAVLLTLIDPTLRGAGSTVTINGQVVSSLETSLSSVVATLGNVGPGLGGVGPTTSYAWFSPQAKILLSIVMLLGRLEIYTVLVLILPRFWRN